MEEQTAYLVTEGEYSDYRVVGVFLDRAAAEKCVALLNAPSYRDGAQIEEFAIGWWDGMDQKPWTVHFVVLDLASGKEEKTRGGTRTILATEAQIRSRGSGEVWPPLARFGCSGGYARGMSYVSLAHAHKLAVEARQKWMAENPDEAWALQNAPEPDPGELGMSGAK